MVLYRIISTEDNPCDDGPLYWSNDMGWVDKKSANVFTEIEHDTCYLPMGGKWEKVR
jgi:hypothetical protein